MAAAAMSTPAPAYDVVFSHLAVRLIKTTVGSPAGTPPLHHIHGPMQLVAVTPAPPMLPTLVLSLPAFTLPFRTFDPQAATALGASGIHDAEPPRPAYVGFGAGSHGLDGPAIWFKEHITEEGAWARKSLGQPAAVWTLYLLGAPAPLANHLRAILAGWPRNMPSALPRWLSDPAMYGWPWKDKFLQMPLPLPLPLPVAPEAAEPVPAPVPPTVAPLLNPRPLPTPPIDMAVRSPPVPPSVPAKPSNLRALPAPGVPDVQPLTPPAEEPVVLANVESTSTPAEPVPALSQTAVPAAASEVKSSPPRRPVSSSGRGVPRSAGADSSAPAPRKIELLPSLPPSTILPNVEHNAWAEPEPAAGSASALPSAAERDAFPAEYRHSLVAVDNETGEVLGILASNVVLDTTSAEYDGDVTIRDADHDDDGDEEETAATPTASRLLHVSKNLPPKPEDAPPLRAFSAYRDPDVYSPFAPSTDPDKIPRPPSRLGEETFAPPPVPDKMLASSAASARDSMASAVFFSAAEELDSGAEDTDAEANLAETDDEGGTRKKLAGAGNGKDSFRLGHHPAFRAVEAYQPGLLRDAGAEEEDDEGAESDRSGSTVGGILTRAFRKKKKKSAGGKKQEAKEEQEEEAREELNIAPVLAVAEAEEAAGWEEEASNKSLRNDGDVSTFSQKTEVPSAVAADMSEEDALSVLRPRDPNMLRQHLPRMQLRTSALIDAEHRVWTDALARDEIPASAPYTHLTAAVASSEPGLPVATRQAAEEAEAIFDVATSSRAAAVAAAAGEYIQGGTVLLKFLQGTISASMANPAQLARYVGVSTVDDTRGQVEASSATTTQPSSNSEEGEESGAQLRTGAMAYIPVLPVHLLYYMGIVADKPPPSETDLPSAAKGALDSVAKAAGVGFGMGRLWKTLVESAVGSATITSASSSMAASASASVTALASVAPASLSLDMLGISKSGAAACWNWMSTAAVAGVQVTTGALQSVVGAAVSSASSSSTPLVRSSSGDLSHLAEDHDDDDDEWEVRIPDFDPNSLGSTPRPVYRRKTKSVLPSAQNGFGVAGQSQVRSTASAGTGSGSVDWKRVSIVHFDQHGVGRRAIMAGGGVGAGGASKAGFDIL
ncbi:hypothetical protein OC844_005920 [Tilletia horrida]|nr:hypothetical protein OC844_005920 [Tilletia horrida]